MILEPTREDLIKIAVDMDDKGYAEDLTTAIVTRAFDNKSLARLMQEWSIQKTDDFYKLILIYIMRPNLS